MVVGKPARLGIPAAQWALARLDLTAGRPDDALPRIEKFLAGSEPDDPAVIEARAARDRILRTSTVAAQTKAFKEKYFAEAAEYESYEGMLEKIGDKLDAVVLVTPHTLHFLQAKSALESIRTEFTPRQRDLQNQQASLKSKEDRLQKDGDFTSRFTADNLADHQKVLGKDGAANPRTAA